jgi:hypothetical protein
LLLLAGLLLPATLLLTWLLTGGLVLLARILVLVAHSGSPLLNAAGDNPSRRHWLRGNNSSITFIPCRRFVAGTAGGTGSKNNPVQAFLARARAVAALGSRC